MYNKDTFIVTKPVKNDDVSPNNCLLLLCLYGTTYIFYPSIGQALE